MQAREIIIALAIKNQGDWHRIYEDVKSRNMDDLEKYNTNVDAITILDNDYPEKLKRINKPPFVLFYKGNKDLLNKKIIVVCGSRETTEAELKKTEKIVNKLNNNDYAVINGMAQGIEHTALETAKNKIAVLGHSLDQCYPNSEKSLKEEIGNVGLLLSEFPLNTLPLTENYMQRDRIIAGLCDKMAVISAAKLSGTFRTIMMALQNNIDIYCLPNLADEESPCNELIKEGANLLISGNELLE